MEPSGKVAIVKARAAASGARSRSRFLGTAAGVALAGRRKDKLDETRRSPERERARWSCPRTSLTRIGPGVVRRDEGKSSGGSTCSSTTPGIGTPGSIMLEDLTLEQWQACEHQPHGMSCARRRRSRS